MRHTCSIPEPMGAPVNCHGVAGAHGDGDDGDHDDDDGDGHADYEAATSPPLLFQADPRIYRPMTETARILDSANVIWQFSLRGQLKTT